MTFADVLQWCQRNNAVVRGVYRGRDVTISHRDQELPAELPAIRDIFHWDVEMPELEHYVSGSDFERIVTGKLTIDGFKVRCVDANRTSLSVVANNDSREWPANSAGHSLISSDY